MTTRWQDIYLHLKKAGFDVYSPGQHVGDCLSPYVVVKSAGLSQIRQFSSTQTLYDLLCYVPKDHYSTLEPFVEGVKQSMKELQPMIMPTHFETESYLDPNVNGHMISVQYRNSRKL